MGSGKDKSLGYKIRKVTTEVPKRKEIALQLFNDCESNQDFFDIEGF